MDELKVSPDTEAGQQAGYSTVDCACLAAVSVVVVVCRYYRSVVCALALAATASLRAQGSSSSSTQAAATLHLQAAKVRKGLPGCVTMAGPGLVWLLGRSN